MSDTETVDQVDERDATTDDDHDDSTNDQELGEKGRDALKRERELRKAKEKEASAALKRIAILEKAQKERDDAIAKEKGDWEKIAQDREDELKKLRAEQAERDLRDRKAAIAKTHGIPDEFVERLKGETDEDIENDAKAVAKLLKARNAPDTDAGERTPTTVKKPDKSKYSDPARWGIRR